MVKKPITIVNESGLHVRPAAVLAKAAEACTSRVEIYYDYNIINAKSLLNILSVSIGQGARIELRCTGPDEETDLEKLINVIENLEK